MTDDRREHFMKILRSTRGSDVVEFLEHMVQSTATSRRLREMTDAEVAQILDDEMLAHTDMTSPQFDLLEAAVMRLRRACGPAMPIPDADDPKATT